MIIFKRSKKYLDSLRKEAAKEAAPKKKPAAKKKPAKKATEK